MIFNRNPTNIGRFFKPNNSSLKYTIEELCNYLNESNKTYCFIETLENFQKLTYTTFHQVFSNLEHNFLFLQSIIKDLKYFKKILDKNKDLTFSDSMYIELVKLINELDELYIKLIQFFKTNNLKFWEAKRENLLARVELDPVLKTNLETIEEFISKVRELNETVHMIQKYLESGEEFVGNDLNQPDFGEPKIKNLN